MAGAAFLDDIQLPGFCLDRTDLVSRVAVGTDRSREKACCELPAVDAFAINGEDPRMAESAGFGDVGPVNPGARIRGRLDIVNAVAAPAVRRHQKAAFADGAAVDRIHVELVDVTRRNVVALGQLWVGVALGTGPREVQVI